MVFAYSPSDWNVVASYGRKPRKAAILRHIRGDVIRFLYSLTLTRRVLMLIAEKTRKEAHRDGLRFAVGFLEIELGMHRTQLIAEEATKPWNQRPALTAKEGLRLVREIVILPGRVRHDVRVGRGSGEDFAAAQRQLFSSATKGLRTTFWKHLANIVWGEVQEHWGVAVVLIGTVVFAVVGWVLDQWVPTLKFAVILALAVLGLQTLLQRWFRVRHLEWYRRLCNRTVKTFYASQAKAACSIVGLEEIGNSEPKLQGNSTRT